MWSPRDRILRLRCWHRQNAAKEEVGVWILGSTNLAVLIVALTDGQECTMQEVEGG